MEAILIRFSSIADSALYLRDLFDFLEMKPNISTSDNSPPFPGKIIKGFTFEDVGFRYPQSKQWVLRNISFNFCQVKKLP
ncbi:MAG: hypothetical protein Ct9H300mP28_33070 [Pseudomonadota bacterium]|nr:MAG: hypothetical protein Ct9H300mP28_33070 [Pseudomonadota bacterium]